jgi:hypothetical protein
MERQAPTAPADEIDLYVRTYASLLRSSGDVDVRAFEEAHSFSGSALHEGALGAEVDVSAFAYAAARLPLEMPDVERIVLGQSHELFEAAGFGVPGWKSVEARGRRRPMRWDGARTLAVFVASASDIDDLVPIVTAYQIEWNKMHARLRGVECGESPDAVALALGLDHEGAARLSEAFGPGRLGAAVRAVTTRRLDLKVRMLAASHSQYQRAAQRWWSGVEPTYLRREPRRPPVYFVSSNTHAIANLVGGFALSQSDRLETWIRGTDPEGLVSELDRERESGSEAGVAPILYYLLRSWIRQDVGGARRSEVRSFETSSGLSHLSLPGNVQVDAQIIALSEVDPARIDPRLRVRGIEKLAASEAIIINIDYPLGMAAYYLLSRLGQGVGDLRGVYVMGKAATLNGRVGDVSLSGACYDEHSRNTFLFKNAFSPQDVARWLRYGSVFDNQAALTVRSAFLQNRRYMTAFYRGGYTVLEMEAGPFLGAVYELIYPHALPVDEIVHLSDKTPFELGVLHYASDTPYSRRQSLLSKSLSYFGVDSTYACAIAIVRRIFEQEVQRVGPR